jgi:hypothetical protein
MHALRSRRDTQRRKVGPIVLRAEVGFGFGLAIQRATAPGEQLKNNADSCFSTAEA